MINAQSAEYAFNYLVSQIGYRKPKFTYNQIIKSACKFNLSRLKTVLSYLEKDGYYGEEDTPLPLIIDQL